MKLAALRSKFRGAHMRFTIRNGKTVRVALYRDEFEKQEEGVESRNITRGLQRTGDERASLVRCMGELLKRSVGR
jgi:hypothetical protein